MHSLLVLIWLFLCTVGNARGPDDSPAGKSAIVFVYTLNKGACGANNRKAEDRWDQFPMYIQHALKQAVFTQQQQPHPHARSRASADPLSVVFVSNYKECDGIRTHIIDKVQAFTDSLYSPGRGTGTHNGTFVPFHSVDTSEIQSPRIAQFINSSGTNIFMSTHGDLWVAAAARFFWMEELMRSRGYTELLHVEADNLLYAPMAPLLPSLRKHYPTGLAATPMDANKSGFTASFLWVASLPALVEFTEYFTELASANHDTWSGYLIWLRRYGCCKTGSGIAEDAQGRGIKPFKVNEMTVMAYYHYIKEPGKFALLPVVPPFPYQKNRYTFNMSHYAPNGEMTGASLYVLDREKAFDPTQSPTPVMALDDGTLPQPGAHALPVVQPQTNAPPDEFGSIFDPGSWGQYLGGTNAHSGRNKKFTDSSHIVGQAVTMNHCVSEMRCGNVPGLHYMHPISVDAGAKMQCYLAPFVQCGDKLNPESAWTLWHPLIQLHVHAKKMEDYVSYGKECACLRE